MKIQELAIIFIIIILPISIVLSVYTQYQVQAINTQTQYDEKLTSATYDAIKAFQINAEDDVVGSDIMNSKLESLEASIKTFRNSLISAFGLNGYTEEDMNTYIPALVYTLYDGFYIYSPYNNTNYRYEEAKDKDGNTKLDENGNIVYDTNKPIEGNGKNIYGLKPYISYSCRYKRENIDVVITYSLDNYITVQGKINDVYYNKSGYLIDNIVLEGENVRYNDTYIEKECITEEIIGDEYQYIKINGTKYYLQETNNGNGQILYFENDGTLKVQCKKNGLNADLYERMKTLIQNNNMAQEYYKKAQEFTSWFENAGLSDLKYEDARDENGNQIWEGNNKKIFKFNKSNKYENNIENESSEFNQHRLAVIRNKIETNLAIAIANYNTYLGTGSTNYFQMPELKEDEWDYITHNISMISFLQGLNIGEITYNGHTVVTNTESSEVVLEQYIYILGNDDSYHRIGDKFFENDIENSVSSKYNKNNNSISSAGRLNLDFNRKQLMVREVPYYYYALKLFNASYNSVIMQDNVTTYDDIYVYICKNKNEALKKAFYTALGRERYGKYRMLSYLDINDITDEAILLSYNKYPEDAEIKGSMFAEPVLVIDHQSKITTDVPSREGYEFQGWSTTKGGGVVYKSGAEIKDIKNSMALYTVWNKKQCTVSYELNGGELSTEIKPQNIDYGKSITITTEIPKREGYKFTGWNYNGKIYQAEDEIRNITQNIILVAQWEEDKITYRLSYDFNGGKATTEEHVSREKNFSEYIKIPGSPEKEGYIFTGWFDSSGTQYYIGKTYLFEGNITLIAHWKKRIYIITYNANGGSDAPGNDEKEHGVEKKLSEKIPKRSGYEFKGWSTSKNGTVKYGKGAIYKDNANLDLYAVWTAIVNEYNILNKTFTLDKDNYYYKGDNKAGHESFKKDKIEIQVYDAPDCKYSKRSWKSEKFNVTNYKYLNISFENFHTSTVTKEEGWNTGTVQLVYNNGDKLTLKNGKNDISKINGDAYIRITCETPSVNSSNQACGIKITTMKLTNQ